MMPQRLLPVSHPLVHPDPAPAPMEVDAPAPVPPPPPPAAALGPDAQALLAAGPNAPPGVLIFGHDPVCRLGLRLAQALIAAAALAAVASARDFASVTAFRYLVSAAALQCLWSLALTILYFYALLVGRSYRTLCAIAIICTGDWITGALIFTAACGSAGITTFVDNDMEACYGNHCPSFMSATAMAFLGWFAIAPCCVQNLGSVVHKLQRR